MLTELGIGPEHAPRFRELWDEHAEPRVCLDYDADDFTAVIQKEFGVTIPDGYSLLQHGFVDRFEPNPSIEPAITRVQSHASVGLLTNMYPRMLQAIAARKGLLPTVAWDVVIDSSEVGMQKPDVAIFEHATTMAHKPKEQVLFIDNTVGNLEAAAAYGWQTYHYDSLNYEKSSQALGQYLMELFA